MKPTESFASQGLRDVWAWKAAIYQEVRNLPVEQALHKILDDARTAADALALRPGQPLLPRKVAESAAAYRVKK
jgi:hypothetical protein